MILDTKLTIKLLSKGLIECFFNKFLETGARAEKVSPRLMRLSSGFAGASLFYSHRQTTSRCPISLNADNG